MHIRKLAPGLLAAVAAASVATGALAAAQVKSVNYICELTTQTALTVEVRQSLPVYLEFRFHTLPSGMTYFFPANLQSDHRKFALPPGTYRLDVKMPAYPTVDTYNKPVIVKPYQVVGGRCVTDTSEQRHGPYQ